FNPEVNHHPVDMKKNFVIAALIVWNLVVMGLFVLVVIRSRSSSNDRSRIAAAVAANTENDAMQEFTFSAGENLSGDAAPQVGGRGLAIAAVIDTQTKDGVIISQGGDWHGYTLYVQGGELFFAVRRDQTLTIVPGGQIAEGRRTITATWTKAGNLDLAMDGRSLATGKAEGGIKITPLGGLEIGSDSGGAVGPYKVPSRFGGIIHTASLRTTP
ncbi:MAG TPA: hypothetical protein VNT99_14510, partial [Methylomirabilota bacterium]|nr:hypothetical protein [Methylomirabilota bacterium]